MRWERAGSVKGGSSSGIAEIWRKLRDILIHVRLTKC